MIAFAAGLALCLLAWWIVLSAGVGATGRVPFRARLLDVMPVLCGFVAALAVTARPILSGLMIGLVAVGLSVVDRVKRVVLLEPVVFADRSELIELVRHPQLYLPFAAGPAVIVGVAAALIAAVCGIAWVEPPLWPRSTLAFCLETAGALAAVLACFKVPSLHSGLLAWLARRYTAWFAPSGDPAADAAGLGVLTCLVVHATIAAEQRPARRAAAAENGLGPFSLNGPVVLVQAESFFDPTHLHPDLAGRLPGFSSLSAAALRRGRLDVPAWGANTVRTEFAILTGVTEGILGLDRFNPYDAFVGPGGPPLPSLAAAARAAGLTTIFVHPFDLSFYARRAVLPRLGFDELIGPDAFADSPRRGAYVSDKALGEKVSALIHTRGPRVFVFVATMEAHGPWDDSSAPSGLLTLPPSLRTLPGANGLAKWLWHLEGTDRMLTALAQTLRNRAAPGWLGFYGDHQPSLPDLFDAIGFRDHRTDYLMWSAASEGTESVVEDIEASGFAQSMLHLGVSNFNAHENIRSWVH
jgi:hypothetical protein